MKYPEFIRDILKYNYLIREFKSYNGFLYNLSLYRYFFKWRFYRTKNDTLFYRIPWITFPAIHYLEKYIRNDMNVFEYGCGGSTLFFAKRVHEVISVEHDVVWYTKLTDYIKLQNINNVKLKNIEPLKVDGVEQLYSSGNESYSDLSFKNYVTEIENYPDNYFDVVFIDGRSRVACFLHSIPKLKKGGIIVWDNTERSRYRDNFFSQPHNLKKIEVPGPTAFSNDFTLTTIFNKN